MNPVYLDHNATTPVDAIVFDAMEPFLKEDFANLSSNYSLSRRPNRTVRDARRQIVRLVKGSTESELVFTSGGTESNNTAILSALKTQKNRDEIIISTVGHASIRKLALDLRNEGYVVHEIAVDESGLLRLEDLKQVLSQKTAIVSLLLANNETGVLFPIDEIGVLVKESGALFHVDAVQAAGKIFVSVESGLIDFLSLSAHKFYGPKGIGVLYVRNGTPYHSLLVGGSQERGKRSGTENVAGIAGMGAAAKYAVENLEQDSQWLRYLRDEFEERVLLQIPDTVIHCRNSKRLPNTSNLHFKDVDAEALIILLDQDSICASRGSACMSGADEPSHVLKAIGLNDVDAKATLRLSFGKFNSKEDLDKVMESLVKHVEQLRKKLHEKSEKVGKGLN